MDRPIVYPGSIPLDTDLLGTNVNTMKAIGNLIGATLGTATVVDGLTCTQTTVPSMSVTVSPGSVTGYGTVDFSAYGSLAADSSALVKMGVNMSATTLGPMTAPSTAGQSIVYLVQAAFSETDTTPVVLPYYNAASPSTPYSGPSNSGSAQNTKRVQTVTLQLKAGAPATTGSQAAPAADTGFVALYQITIANGASSIVNANIATAPTAPFINYKLPSLRPGFSTMLVYTASSGWTAPAGVTKVKLRMVGGGGSGASSASGSNPGGGGGGGAYVETVVTVTPGTTYTVTVGAGGSNNSAGTASSFAGQTAGGGSAGGAGTSSAPGAGGAGGSGSITGAGIVVPGGAGSFGIYYSSSCVEGGNGGGTPFASPVRAIGTPGTALAASPGLLYGGGSTGCTGTGYANGGGGVVILEY